MAQAVRVAVTGAAGRVANSLIVRIASGEVFGPDVPVILQLLELPVAMKTLEGILYELQDCAFPTLQDVIITDDANRAFEGCNWAILVGAAPRGPGEQRSDLIRKNGPIFVEQGRVLARRAASDVRILVVGNPCNTNCLIAWRNGRDIPAERWHAMTRLDHNRAVYALAAKANVPVTAVTCMTIWGNHSNTQYPDFTNARINGRPATEVITDRQWLETVFVPQCQERGKFIIDTTKVSSSFSAANGAIDHIKSLVRGTPSGDWTSAALVSRGEYGVPEGIVFGYPVTSRGDGCWQIVEGLKLDEFGQQKFQITLQELIKERDVVQDLLPS
ncbi:MAG: malate dehydrogenase [Thermogemmata sp.]|jgi:malate dehydrogenase|uniref:Malate dehydrogenase n=1 Tax=Thermogemmata fonticola TaxID=2755323 RepID=A0A7V8VC22_9BACT|nr:malate dehydrogenase [Thermogemmata fonticola]MBA2225281.1 malate dehydrogenase [Thermogemmata fonticola]MCX8139341.1 malate dehydrogenase [Gemmataceae bacterium]GIW83888.1 MAG: malate dehydrogenase [Gemmataceae bacterium]